MKELEDSMCLSRLNVESAFKHFGVEGCTTARMTNKLNEMFKPIPALEQGDVESFMRQAIEEDPQWVCRVDPNWQLLPVKPEKLPTDPSDAANTGKVVDKPSPADNRAKPRPDNHVQQREKEARKGILDCQQHPLFPETLKKSEAVINGWSGAELFEKLAAAQVIVQAALAIEGNQNHPVYASREAEIVRLKKVLQDALTGHKSVQRLADDLVEEKRSVARSYLWSKVLLFVAVALFTSFCVAAPYVPLFARMLGFQAEAQQATETTEEEPKNAKDDSQNVEVSLEQALENFRKSRKK